MACSWSPDDKTISTSSADCTVKLCVYPFPGSRLPRVDLSLIYPLGDVETRKATQTWSLGSGVSNQQVGNVWSPSGEIVSLSISGDLNVFDARVGDAPARVLKVCLIFIQKFPERRRTSILTISSFDDIIACSCS